MLWWPTSEHPVKHLPVFWWSSPKFRRRAIAAVWRALLLLLLLRCNNNSFTRSQARDQQRCCDQAMMAMARCIEKSGIMARWSEPPCCQNGAAGDKHAQRLLQRGELLLMLLLLLLRCHNEAFTRSQARDLQRCCVEAVNAQAARRCR